jgi:hypothetical protein
MRTYAIVGIRYDIVHEQSPPRIDKTEVMLGKTIATPVQKIIKMQVIMQFSH